ncbi:MAG: hypothetical protein AAGK23_13680, partial [Pseudomonadota bacterium]
SFRPNQPIMAAAPKMIHHLFILIVLNRLPQTGIMRLVDVQLINCGGFKVLNHAGCGLINSAIANGRLE